MGVNRGKHFEDFEVGEKIASAGRTITEVDIVNFVNLSGYCVPLFLDREFLFSETPFKRRLAPGALTYVIAEGLLMQTGLLSRCIAYLGTEMKAIKPVFRDDTIHVDAEIIAKRETKNPTRGIVTFSQIVRNQDGEVVINYTAQRMAQRRPASS